MEEETERVDDKMETLCENEKKRRSRKKLLRTKVRKQMEFYFSDSNISKDRFMNQLLQESPSIDVSVFLKFNKIKSLTTNIKDVVKAIEKSDFLKITDCGTKIYRATPFKEKTNTEECTIYVENIPSDADHMFLSDIFETYGPIDYISLPRYKCSRKNKGFAFVEFKEPESVRKAMDAFANLGSCLSNQMEPGQLRSVVTYIEENKEVATSIKRMSAEEKEEKADDSGNSSDQCKEAVVNAKAESSSDEKLRVDSESGFRKKKKKLLLEENEKLRGLKLKFQFAKKEASKEDYCVCRKAVGSKPDDCVQKENELVNQVTREGEVLRKRRSTDSDNEHPVKKAKVDLSIDEKSRVVLDSESGSRKKKKKLSLDESEQSPEKLKLEKKNSFSSEEEANVKLKNEASSEHDEIVTVTGEGQESSAENTEQETTGKEDNEIKEQLSKTIDKAKERKRMNRKKKSKRDKTCVGLQILTKKEWKHLRNKYLEEQRSKMNALKARLRASRWEHTKEFPHKQAPVENINVEQEEKEKWKKRVSFSPGVMVKLTMEEPIVNITSFKNEAKLSPGIKYVDINECSTFAHLRFSNAEAAEQFCQKSPWPGAAVLSGSEEISYWDKLWKDRDNKLNKNIRVQKKGRQKLLEKAEDMRVKHVRFDG